MNKSIQRVIALVVMLAVVMSATVYGASSFTIHYQELASDAPVVMTVNGDEIHSDEYAGYMEYNMAYYASMYAQMGISDLWNNAEAAAVFGPSMPDAAKEQAVYTRVIMQKMKELGLSLSYSQEKQLANARKQTIDNTSYDGYLNQIAQFGFSDTAYTNFMYLSLCYQTLEDYYYGENGVNVPSEEELKQYFEDNYITAKHILITTTNSETGETRTDEEAKALAQSILDRINNGEDFDTLMTQYNEDPGMASNPNGYTFTDGQMVDEFYEGAKALGEGEVSGLVKSQYGYHIIMRTVLDESQLDSNRDDIVSAIASTKDGAAGSMDELLTQWIEAADVETTDVYDEITYENVADYLSDEVKAIRAEDASDSKDADQSDSTDSSATEEQSAADEQTAAQAETESAK